MSRPLHTYILLYTGIFPSLFSHFTRPPPFCATLKWQKNKIKVNMNGEWCVQVLCIRCTHAKSVFTLKRSATCLCVCVRTLVTESCQIVRLAECQKLNGAVKPSASDVNACIACFVNAVECLVFPAQH